MMSVNREENRHNSKKSLFREALRLLIRNFFEHRVGKNAAALAYYLLFALFPLLIFICNLLGVLNLDIHASVQTLQRVLPKEVVVIIETYLEYISNTSSHTLLWFSLVFSVWFPMRAAKGLMEDVRLAYGLGKPQNPAVFTIRRLIYTVVFLIVIVLTLLLSTLGEHVLVYIQSMLPGNVMRISDIYFALWQYLRFLPVGLLMFLAIGTLYSSSTDEKQPFKTILPGIFAALFSWLVVSVGFSFYVENFASYTVIYGTLGAVIVLMIWLYLTAGILILGAELNAALNTLRTKN
ncbi:MAG: YihY/virulence factor BrkB family protein [Clostridia bacterium]|nr:YihY/virulence factor BrkB family protein [Clostridia bacterium]